MGIFPLTEHGKGSKKIAKAADKISSDCSLDLKGKARKGAPSTASEAREMAENIILEMSIVDGSIVSSGILYVYVLAFANVIYHMYDTRQN